MKNKKPCDTEQDTVLLGLAYREQAPSGKWKLRIRWWRLFLTTVLLCILGYIGLTTALYFYVKSIQEYSQASYWSMYTLPFNRDEHRLRVGNYQVDKGKELLQEGDYRNAFSYLREGVTRSPENLEGRLLLVEYFLNAFKPSRPELAIELLKEGLQFNPDANYYKRYIELLLEQQQEHEVTLLADQVLQEEIADEIKETVAIGAANANYLKGNYDIAEKYLLENQLENNLNAILIISQIKWEQGNREEAILKLEQGLAIYPNNKFLYTQLGQFHRLNGDLEKARQYAALRGTNAPMDPAPRIELLYLLDQAEDEDRVKLQANSFLNQFSSNARGLLHLAKFATYTSRVDLMKKIYERALENNLNIAPFALYMIECQIKARQYQFAIDFIAELLIEKPKWLEQNWSTIHSLQAIAYLGMGNKELSNSSIMQLQQSLGHNANEILAVSIYLEQLGEKNEARRLLAQAYRDDPKNQAVLMQLIKIELELGNSTELSQYLNKMLTMRRPPVELLTSINENIGSDRFIFTQDRNLVLKKVRDTMNQQLKTKKDI